MKVAIVHDWLIGGGAELVVQELHKMYPDAPIYTSYCTDEWRKRLDSKVVTGFLQRKPFGKLRKLLPVARMWWFSRLDLSGYDLVISSSGNGEAMGVRVPKGTLHISYCHSPTHYYWRHYDEYLRRPGLGWLNPLVRLGLRLLVRPLRKWDYQAAQGPDYLIANSAHIQKDIKRYYGRDSVIIHPPVDISRFKSLPIKKRHSFVTAGRLVPFKQTDLIVKACSELNLPLTVIGKGPQLEELRRIAGSSVTIAGFVPDEEVARRLATAQGFIFASFEDFGITPVEAMAAGTPVIAYKAGGALEYVEPGVTGTFFERQTVDSLKQALESFDPTQFNPKTIRTKATTFSPQIFTQKMQEFITKVTK